MRIYKWLLIVTFSFLPPMTFAKELQYFDGKIDYWNEKPSSKDSIPVIVTGPSEENFPWKTYLDPKNKEFFKEGDYTPPEPFMEIARNPSDDNIKNWFEFMKRKNELASRLQTRMQEYLAKNQNGGTTEVPIQKAASPANKISLDPSRFKIRMYFDSHCPHCKHMFQVLKRFQSEGYQVEALQVDSGPVPPDEQIVPIAKGNLAELKSHGGEAVPYLLIADLKRKALLPGVQGYHEYGEVAQLLREASQ